MLPVQFLSKDKAVAMLSSGVLEDLHILFGGWIVVTPLADGRFELVGVEHPSPMRHFESSGGENSSFPTEEQHRIGDERENELMYWTTHIPGAEFDGF